MTIDPITLGVMASRVDSVAREMTNTMVRTARSTTMASKDFSCSIAGPNHDMLSCPDANPVHVYGTALLAQAMADTHPDFREGDCFLSNDPYVGNSHAADYTFMVPIFFEGEHVFTALAKAHQADCGNALPTTYMPTATDVYNEGALIFPCVKIQSGYTDNTDLIRMCERRIRAFDIWYGDYLATLGACRLAERRLKEFCEFFGVEATREFVTAWLDYSEEMAGAAIGELPAGKVISETRLDPFPGLPDGIPLKAEIDVDPAAGRITIDLRDNPDCVPVGLNLTESTTKNAATSAVLYTLNGDPDATRVRIPNNSGTHRRIEILVRDNCVVGAPKHPYSASCATTTVQDRVVGMVSRGLSLIGEGVGTAEQTYGSSPVQAVVSGQDARRDGAPYILQIFSGTAGGPATPQNDGWLTYLIAGASGMGYVDSTEISEQKYPLVVWEKVVRADSEGAGRTRGAPGNVSIFGPTDDTMTCHWFMDGRINRPLGAREGGAAQGPEAWTVSPGGEWGERDEIVGELDLAPRESIVSLSAGGGGYGPALERDPEAVLVDVIDDYVSPRRAEQVYGVVLTGDPARWETLRVDPVATAARRASLGAAGPLTLSADDAGRSVQDTPNWWTEA
ncbi:MAG: hydantoinase B/oxoprolinase family protein [Solirubrobacteraceae bacterium]|nr:hydantoinase B/oxoprolinase family protein [Solirubrobacteraceae bacterium]